MTRTLIAIITAFLAVSGAKAQERVDNAIVLAADVSSSMDAHERNISRESHARAIASREVVSAIFDGAYQRTAFAYVEYGSTAQIVVGWTMVDSQASADALARQIMAAPPRRTTDATGIGNALVRAVELFEAAPFEALFRTVDVAGDGKSNTGVDVSIPRSILIDMGITINGLPMTLDTVYDDLPAYFADEIMGGPRAFSIEINRIEDMPMAARRKIAQEIG